MILRLDRRHVRGEPLLQLVHERRGIVEQAVDETDSLAVEAGQARRQAFAGHLRRISTRIMNSDNISHACLRPATEEFERLPP